MGNKAQARVAKQDAPVTSDALELTKPQAKAVAEMTTVSARIRYLHAEKYSNSQITKLITNAKGGQLLYQHVRNVLTSKAPKASS